jgi:hypothetical protein
MNTTESDKQRVIKFRAYLPGVKVMLDEVTPYHSGLIGIDADTLDELVKPHSIDDESIQDKDCNILMPIMSGDDWYWIDTPHYHLMQFTGLLDKNGKEIYEGDRLKFFEKEVAVVVWQDFGGWSFQWTDPTYRAIRQHNPEPFFRNINLFEVIGHIYSLPSTTKEEPKPWTTTGTAYSNPPLSLD